MEGSNSNALQPNVNDAMRIFVGDLPYFCEEQHLHDLFSQFGHVRGVNLVHNERGHTMMHGYVEMVDEAEANAAEAALEGRKFMGRRLRVAIGGSNSKEFGRSERNEWVQVHISFLSRRTEPPITEELLESVCQAFGEVMDVSIKKHNLIDTEERKEQNGYGFAFYRTYDEAKRAVAGLRKEVPLNNVTYDCHLTYRSKNLEEKQQRNSPREVRNNTPTSLQPTLSHSTSSSSGSPGVNIAHLPGVTPPAVYHNNVYLPSNPVPSPPVQYASPHYQPAAPYMRTNPQFSPELQQYHSHNVMMPSPPPPPSSMQGMQPPLHSLSTQPFIVYSAHMTHGHMTTMNQPYGYSTYSAPHQPPSQLQAQPAPSYMYTENMPYHTYSPGHPMQSYSPQLQPQQQSMQPMPYSAPINIMRASPGPPRPRSQISAARITRHRVQQQTNQTTQPGSHPPDYNAYDNTYYDPPS